MEFFEFVRKAFQNYGNHQRGEGVTTRRQAAAAQQQQQQQQQQPIASELENEENAIDEPMNIEPNEQLQQQLSSQEMEPMEQDIELEQETEEPNENDLYNSETLIAENDLVKVYIIKDYFKRQKIFK